MFVSLIRPTGIECNLTEGMFRHVGGSESGGAAIERRISDLASQQLGEEFYYCSLPLFVIDAVFSIQARYTAVQAVVWRWCEYQSPQWRIPS